MTTDVVPIVRVSDAGVAARWYARLGFEVEFEHRFEPHLPADVGIRREGAQLTSPNTRATHDPARSSTSGSTPSTPSPPSSVSRSTTPRGGVSAHLTDDFTEFGYSGRSCSRSDTLDMPVGTIDGTLADIEVRPAGRDAALVTYRSVEPRGATNRSSIWRRVAGERRLGFHQGTPTG